MFNSLKLHQGPGLNGLFVTAVPLSCDHDEPSDTTTYVLNEGYTLRLSGYPLEAPYRIPLKPETYKLMDILVCKLGDSEASRRVELPLDELLQFSGYTVTQASKDDLRPRLKKSATILGALRVDWVEKEGRYVHRDVRFFDEIIYGNGRIYACFNEAMVRYLRSCPSLPLPLPLLAVSGKSPHSYFLGRRCLVHNATNRGQEWQAIRVRSLLAVCPRIPRPGPEGKWPPSILTRKVITPFTEAMNSLVDLRILSWRFREPVCRSDYDGFAAGTVEFRLLGDIAPALPAEPKATHGGELLDFDYDTFLKLR